MKSFQIDKDVDIKLFLDSKDENFDCEFHDDDESASIIDNHYVCKCCGANLTASQFLSQKKGISRDESLALLYRVNSQSIPDWLSLRIKPNLDGFKLYKRLFEILSEELYEDTENAKECLKYISLERKITNKTIKDFQLGYFPKDKAFLQKLTDEFGDDLLKEFGIITNGKYGDFSSYRDRLIFPIRNTLGQPCGVGARALNNEVKPKYYNSQASIIFSKSDILYSDPYEKKDKAVITEGYMDVISCSQSDDSFSYYASLGTALNSSQVRDILRAHDTVTICTDGDNAGQTSIMKFIKEQLGNLPHERIKFAKIPNNLDPDEFISKNGIKDFQCLIENSQSAKDFIQMNHADSELLTVSEELDKLNIAP